jgi:hypothetical protein
MSHRDAPYYFERQVAHHCTIHAANNALGQKILTLAAMNNMARSMAQQQAARTQDRQQAAAAKDPSRQVQRLQQLKLLHLKPLVGPLGKFSPDVSFRLLRGRHGIYARHSMTSAFPMGAWVILGEVAYPDPHDSSKAGGTYAHAVAVRDGCWLDSEQDRPFRLPVGDALPSYFTPWGYYSLSTDPIPEGEATVTVDLAQDD